MRIRTIKPEFWSNEDIDTVSDKAKLLAIALLNYADDEGYFRANPKLIKATLFPLNSSVKTTVLLRELSDIGYIELCKGSDGKEYGRLPTFLEHQVINKSKSSRIKDLWTLRYDYGSTTVGLPPGTGNREQGTGKGIGKEFLLPYGKAFEKKWNEWIEYRQHGKFKKLQNASLKAQIKKLSNFESESRAIAIIDNTIEKGYQGLYEASNQSSNQSKSNNRDFERKEFNYPEGQVFNND
jgi:hypothetical protein